MRQYLKKARKELGLKQEDVAKHIGISTNYYCDIENGTRQKELKSGVLSKLSTLLNIPVEKILDRMGIPNNYMELIDL